LVARAVNLLLNGLLKPALELFVADQLDFAKMLILVNPTWTGLLKSADNAWR